MKTAYTLAFAFITMMASSVNAQEAEASRIKILPTGTDGVIKLLFAMKTEEPVTVRFFSDGEMVKRDRIAGGPFEKGLMKRYDVSSIDHKDYWVEVACADMKVTYRVIPRRDGKTFTPFLESATFRNDAVASRN